MGMDLHGSHLCVLHATLLGRALQHIKLHNQMCSACSQGSAGLYSSLCYKKLSFTV